jgi:hypothetical protein
VEAKHPSAFARVCCIYVVGILSCWFALVNRAISWLYCIGKDILYKKVCWVFFPCVEEFPKMYMLMLRGGTSRCLWLGGNGVALPMERRACKRSSNCYG